MGESPADRAHVLGNLVARIQALAARVAARSRWVGRLALVAAPVAWITLFGRWAFDSVPRFVFFAAVLGLLLLPGAVLLVFARLLSATVSTSQASLSELAGMLKGTGTEIGGGIAEVSASPGLRSLASLLGSLWKLREFRSDFGSVVASAVGSTRLFNPLFLLWVGAAALGAGFVLVLAVVGLVVVLV